MDESGAVNGLGGVGEGWSGGPLIEQVVDVGERDGACLGGGGGVDGEGEHGFESAELYGAGYFRGHAVAGFGARGDRG